MLRIFNLILITSLFIFIGSKASFTSTILMSENFEDKNNLKVADYNENWTIEKLDNGNSVYCNKRKNSWTEFNFGEENWNNYSISYKIKFGKGKAGKLETHIRKKKYTNVEYRSNHRESGVTYLEYVSGPNKILDRIINGSKALIRDNWVNIKLIASGNNIAYFVNDKIVASTKDDRLKNGAAMIAVSANSKACVDDIIVTKLEENEYHQEANKENKQKELEAQKEEEFKAKALAEKKAEEEAKIKALAEKLAKEEIAKQLKQKEEQKKKVEELAKQKALAEKKAEELAKQKALAEKKAKEEARKKELAKKKAEELAKQKVLAEKKAKEEAKKKALAKKKAEELVKQKALAEKKAKEEALKQKVLNEKIAKIKDEAQFFVETLKEYVTTDKNKLDILEVSELLENYDNEKHKGWSDATIEKYEALYDYVQKDDGFVTFSSEKKSKQLAAYNEEIRHLREYLTTSQANLKEFITKNLGSKNAKEALKLAKEAKLLLKDFDVGQAMTLKNNISTWKAMNGVTENKKYAFKILNKKIAKKKQSVIKKVNQNKLADNTKKKNLKSAPLSVPKGKVEASTFCFGFLGQILRDNWIKQMPPLVKTLKRHSDRHLLAIGILPSRGITGQNMMEEGWQAVIDIAGKSIEEADIERGTSLHSLIIQCSSLDTLKSGVKKSNKISSKKNVQQNQKKNKAIKLKSNLSKPNHKDSIFRKADNLNALASKCYLSVPSVHRSTIASIYSNANKMYDDGVKFIKMKQTDTAINMLRSANMQYENMIRVGRQVGGRSC